MEDEERCKRFAIGQACFYSDRSSLMPRGCFLLLRVRRVSLRAKQKETVHKKRRWVNLLTSAGVELRSAWSRQKMIFEGRRQRETFAWRAAQHTIASIRNTEQHEWNLIGSWGVRLQLERACMYCTVFYRMKALTFVMVLSHPPPRKGVI